MIVGIGIDLAEVARIRREVERRGDGVLEEVLTPLEREYCQGLARPWPSIAARFAAKEALFKALGTGKRGAMAWREVEVRRDDLGKPDLAVSGATGRRIRELQVRMIHVSLTHTDDEAMAAVLLEK